MFYSRVNFILFDHFDIIFRIITRYDPTKSEHKIIEKSKSSELPYEKKKKKPKKKEKSKSIEDKEITKTEMPKPEVSKEKHYSVADTLKDAFKKNDESEFRLSALFDEKLKSKFFEGRDS